MTITIKSLLKLSGSESNPFDGANLLKKTSGPPRARTRVWDSRLADVEMIYDASSTWLEYDATVTGARGIRGPYL